MHWVESQMLAGLSNIPGVWFVASVDFSRRREVHLIVDPDARLAVQKVLAYSDVTSCPPETATVVPWGFAGPNDTRAQRSVINDAAPISVVQVADNVNIVLTFFNTPLTRDGTGNCEWTVDARDRQRFAGPLAGADSSATTAPASTAGKAATSTTA